MPDDRGLEVMSNAGDSWDRYREAFCALSRIGIAVCLLRDDPAALDGVVEVDILIDRRHLAAALAELQRLGWVILDNGLFIPCKRSLRLYHDGRLLAIDLHYEVVDRGLVYMDARRMLACCRAWRDGLVLPAPEDWLLHVLLHVVLGKPVLADKYVDRVRAVLDGPLDHEAMLADADRFGLAPVARELLAEPIGPLRDASRVRALRARARAALLRRPGNARRVVGAWLVNRLGPWLGMRRGFAIAMIGPDGAGKSSFSAAMREKLVGLGIPVREVYMGPWARSILPSSKALEWLGADPRDHIPGTERSNPATMRHSKLLKGVVRRYLYYGNIFLEFWARYLRHVLPHLLRRRVVMMDRYIYDLEVGYQNRILRNAPGLRRLIVALTPKPHYTLLLTNDPEVIWARKKDFPLEVIREALAVYYRVALRHGATVIETTRPTDALVEDFLAENWRDFVRRRRDRFLWIGR